MSKTKAQLENENARLSAEIAALHSKAAGLRELIAAVHEAAVAVPSCAASEPEYKELHRAKDMLGTIGVITDPEGTWTWSWSSGQGAEFLREQAATPVGYKVFQRGEHPYPEADDYFESNSGTAPCNMPERHDPAVPGVTVMCDVPTHHANTALVEMDKAPGSAVGAGEDCDADWGSATTSQVCTKPLGHDGLHLDSEAYEWGDGVTPRRTKSVLANGGEPYRRRAGDNSGCGAVLPGEGYRCTRLSGHPGRHEAHGTSPLVTWTGYDGEGYEEIQDHECPDETCLDTGHGAGQGAAEGSRL